MEYQNELTLVTPVNQGGEDVLSQMLLKIKLDLEAGRKEPFETGGNIHFARWVFVNKKAIDQKFESILESRLVFSSIYDGNEEEHLNYLSDAAKLGTFVDQLYKHCIGYPADGERTSASRKEYLKRWRAKPAAFYVGAPGRSLERILKESKLRNFIRDLLNRSEIKSMGFADLHKFIQQHVFTNPEFQWAKETPILPKVNWPGMLLMAAVLIVLLPLLVIWILVLHIFYERRDEPFTATRSQISELHMQDVEEYEDLQFQNQFTQLLIMKPGLVRLMTFKGLMLFARVLIKFKFVNGKLMGIPTIHFARWTLLDNNKHVIFFSNFDGSWQQYLSDFIDKSGWGLTGIFSNTMNFPKTRFLLTGGAYDEEHFLAWSRQFEIPTQVWYSAYPNLSIKNIVNNSLIQSELSRDLNEPEAQRFLKRF